MKSFFKKLAFVMALAMVVSMVAPAGTAAHAAESGVAYQTSKEVVTAYEFEKAGDQVDFCFLGAPKDWKTTYAWTSSNEAVATVDKAGVVTAVAAGTATITITAGADASYVQTVVVTVPAPVVTTDFTVKQLNTTTVKLTFNAKQDVTVDNLGFAMLIGDVYVTIPVKAVSVDGNVATVTLFSAVSDGQEYRFTFGESTVDFTASVGAIDHVAFTYWTDEAGDGLAYVSAEGEECEVTLVPVLYDANNVDVTSVYDLDELAVEFEAADSDAYEMTSGETICFENPGAAVVTLNVSWTDDDTAEDVVKTFTGVIVAQKRPDLKVTITKAAMFPYCWMSFDKEGGFNDFTTNPWSYYWADAQSWAQKTAWTYGDWDNDGNGLVFAALATDNRGNTIATGSDYDYGYFTFETSNDDVIDVADGGEITIVGEGSATVLIYFVNTTGEEDVKTFVSAQKITVYPQRYPATYKISSTSATTITAGSTSGSYKLTVYDQYNEPIQLAGDTADIIVEAMSDTNEVTDLTVTWNSNGYYQINYNGADFADMVGTASSKTYKYKVTVDKESNEMITSAATATLSLKVVNTNTAATKLNNFLDEIEGAETPTKFYYSHSQNTSSVDVKVDNVANFCYTDNDAAKKTAKVTVKYLTANNGYTLGNVPSENLINITGEDVTTGDMGYVYFTVEGPKNNNGAWTAKESNGTITLTFNSTTDGFTYATAGTYKVTLKTSSKNEGTLKTLATYSFNVYNSQPEVKYASYDEELGNKTTTTITKADIDDNTVEALVRSNLEFTINGGAVDMDTIRIDKIDYTPLDGKVRIDKVYFSLEVDDGDDDTDYRYQSVATVKKWIYEAE